MSRSKSALAGILAIVLSTPAMAAGAAEQWLGQLSDPDRARRAVDALVEIGAPAIPDLSSVARRSDDIVARGWAIVALGRIPSTRAIGELEALSNDTAAPALVRTWAAAARIGRATTTDEILESAKLQGSLPALERPLQMQFEELVHAGRAASSVEELLRLAARLPKLKPVVVQTILAKGARPLVKVMTRAQDDTLRREAAGYLGALAQSKGPDTVAKAVVAAYAFRPDARAVPWSGGALYVPGIAWPKREATKLVESLIAWHVYCDVRGQVDLQRQIHNNIRSLSLAGVVGYQSPGWSEASTVQWLQIWSRHAGKSRVRTLLRRQKQAANPKYKAALRGR